MAVELRCPDCRAKLRLKAAPDPGTDVECPKCGTVFPAPEPEPEPEPEEEAEEKPARAEKGAEKGAEKKEKKKKKAKDPAAANAPKKRKAKKRETSKAALIAVIATGVFMLLTVTGVLIWYFTRTSKSVEMMYYVPDDANDAVGMNLGHAQKYPEFNKSLAQLHAGTDYKAAGDAIAKAAGLTDMDALADYMVQATAPSGSAIVFRTKAEFDEDALKKLPGAEKKTLDGKTFYLASAFVGSQKQRVFAPTNRLVVVTPETTKDAAFKKMLAGHADNKENTLGVRMGELGKRATRGTFWRVVVATNEKKVPDWAPPQQQGSTQNSDDPKLLWYKTITEALSGAKGYAMKASLGSRELRFEMMAWYKDTEKTANTLKKWREHELSKGGDGTPPRWFEQTVNNMGDKKVYSQLRDNISFGSAGEVFFVKSSAETVDIQTGASNAISRILDRQVLGQGGPGPGMGPGGGVPGGGVPGPVPGGGVPGPGPTPGKPPRVRRPHRAYR